MNQAVKMKTYKLVDKNREFSKKPHQEPKENYSNKHHRYRKRCDLEDISFGIKKDSILVRERDLRWLHVLHDVERRNMSVKHVFHFPPPEPPSHQYPGPRVFSPRMSHYPPSQRVQSPWTHYPRFSHPRTRINRSNATQLDQEVCRKLQKQNNIEVNLEEQSSKALKKKSIEKTERKDERCSNSTNEKPEINGSETNAKKVEEKPHSSIEPAMQETVKPKEKNGVLSFNKVNSNSESLTNSLNKTALKNDTKAQAECKKMKQSIGDNMPNKISQKEMVSDPKSNTSKSIKHNGNHTIPKMNKIPKKNIFNPKSNNSESIAHDGEGSLLKVNKVSKEIASNPKSDTSENITHDGKGSLLKVNEKSINIDTNTKSKSFGSKDTKVSSNISNNTKLTDKKPTQKIQKSDMILTSDKKMENIVDVDNYPCSNSSTNTSAVSTSSQICHKTLEKQSDNITKTSTANNKIENKDKETLKNCQGETKLVKAIKKNCDNCANDVETVDDKEPSDKPAKIEKTINKTDDDTENDIVEELSKLVNVHNDTCTLSKTKEVDKKQDDCIEQIENLVQEGNLISDVTHPPKPASQNIIKKDIKIKFINPLLPNSSSPCSLSKELRKTDEHEKDTGNTNRNISNTNYTRKPTEKHYLNDNLKQVKTTGQTKDKKQSAGVLKSCIQGPILEDIFILEDALKEIDNEPTNPIIPIDLDKTQSIDHVEISKTSSTTSLTSPKIITAEKNISKDIHIIEDEPEIIEIDDESKKNLPTFPKTNTPPLIIKIESPDKNSNSLQNIEVENSPLHPPEKIKDFGNFDTGMTYLYSFSKYFDDTRTVDMDISYSPSPSENLETSSCSDQQIVTARVLRDLDAMYSDITSGGDSDNVNKVKFSGAKSEQHCSQTTIREGEPVQHKDILIEDPNNIKDKSILEKKSLSNPIIGETTDDQGKNKFQEEDTQTQSVSYNNEGQLNEKKTQGTNHALQTSVPETLIIPQIEISKLIDKSQQTRNKINQLTSNSSSRFQCGDLPSIDIDILLEECKKIINTDRHIRPKRIYRSKSIYCLNTTTNLLTPLRKTKSLNDISQNQAEDPKILDYKDELLSLLSSGIYLKPLVEDNSKNGTEGVSYHSSVLEEQKQNEVKDFELDDLAGIQSQNKEPTNNEVHLWASINNPKNPADVSIGSVPDGKRENEIEDSEVNDLTGIDNKIKPSKNNSCERRKKRVRRLDSSDEESTIPKKASKFAKAKKSEKIKTKRSETLDQRTRKSVKDKSYVTTAKSNSIQKESSAVNSLDCAITQSEITSSITSTTETQKNNTLKDKYVTKAEYIKTFSRMKSPVNISLSIEPQPPSATIKKRRATFTCESDNAAILKKVEDKYKEKCLYLFGDTSDEEELILKKWNTPGNKRAKRQKKERKQPKSKQYIEDTDASSDEINKNSQFSSQFLTSDSVSSSSVKVNLKISHNRRHSVTNANKVKPERQKSNEGDKTAVEKLADKEANDILCKVNVRRESSSSTDSKFNKNRQVTVKGKPRSPSKESDSDKRAIQEILSKHEISIQSNIVDRRHSAPNDSSKSKPNYKNKKIDKQDIVPPMIVEAKRKYPSSIRKINSITDPHRKECSKHEKLTENSIENKDKKISEEASKPKTNSEELVPRTIKTTKSKKGKRCSTNKSNFICSKDVTIKEHVLETNSAASQKRLIQTDRRKSAPDVLNSSSETSLVIDEDQTYPLIYRATENQIIENFESCSSLSLVLPTHQRISIIGTVDNKCEDMVYICDSHYIKSDTVVVQQVSPDIDDDDVIETTPAIPMVDLTGDEKLDHESGPQESLADLLLEAKKEIQAIAEEEGLITLYRSEESTGVTGGEQIISTTISVTPAISELPIVKELTTSLPSSHVPTDVLTNIPENMDTTHSERRGSIQNIVNNSKNNIEVENQKTVSTLLELLQNTPNQSSTDTESAVVEPNITKGSSQKERTTLNANDNSQHSVDCQEVSVSPTNDHQSFPFKISVVSNQADSKHSAQIHANLTKSGYSISTQIVDAVTSSTENVLPCINSLQQSDVIRSSFDSTTHVVETLSSVTANILPTTNLAQQLDGQQGGIALAKNTHLSKTHPPTLVRSKQQSSKTNHETLPSTSRPNIQTVTENTGRVINLTDENVELSSMDIKLIVEIFTRHIYFLAHLFMAQKAYIDSFSQRVCYKHYFKAEIDLFEEQRQQRLKSQSIRLWSELQILNIRASRNLPDAVDLLIEHIRTSLANKDMPRRVTRTFVYLIIGELIRPEMNTFATIPLFKILIRHCSIVSEKVQSRSSGLFTEEMRRTLAHQVEEYTRLFGHPPLLPSQQPIIQLNTQHDRQQQQLQICNENTANISELRNLNDGRPNINNFVSMAGPNKDPTSAGNILDINNPPNVAIRSAITMDQGRNHTTDQNSVRANYVPISQGPTLTFPTASSGKAVLRMPATTRATPVYQQSNLNQYPNMFIRPNLPRAVNSSTRPHQMRLLPGGFNTNSLGNTPRYLPNFDLPRTNQVYLRNLNPRFYKGRGQILQGLVLSRNQTSQQESQFTYSAQGANSSYGMTPLRPPISINTCESRVNNTQHNPRRDNVCAANLTSNSSLPQQTSVEDLRTRNTNLLKELLSTTETECQAVFTKPANPVNDNFRIKLPFTKPVTDHITTVTTTSASSPTSGFTIAVASQPNTISPIQNVSPPVTFNPQQVSQSSLIGLNSQPSLSPSQIASINNIVPSSRIVADATQTSDILNQGLSALSSIGRPEAMISPSPPNDLRQNKEIQPVIKLVFSSPTSRSPLPNQVLSINNQSNQSNIKSQKQNQIITISPASLLKNNQQKGQQSNQNSNVSRKRELSRKVVTNTKKTKIDETIETFEISSDEDCPMQQDPVEVSDRSAEAKDAKSSETRKFTLSVNEAKENSVAAKLQDTLYPDRECQSKDNSSVFNTTFSSENEEISALPPQIPNESENIQAFPLPTVIQPSTSKGSNTLETNTTDKEDDMETIDLTWIDELDEAELQGEIDFIFVKQETAEDENVEKHNNRVVSSPADSGIASPPAQQEEDTFYTVVSSLCVCGQIANYNCACGDASYCGEDCQLKDWDSHQKVCYIPVETTDVEEDESTN